MPGSVVARARPSALTLGLAIVLAAIGLPGCSSGGSAEVGTRVVVVEHDFKITTSTITVPAGTVTLEVENHGPSTHEMNIDETRAAAGALPLRANSLQVNEDSPSLRNVGSLSGVRVGATQDLTLHLTPGRYVLFCNLEGHYLGGMHAALEVTA